MAKKSDLYQEENFLEEDTEEELDIENSDFGFVISGDGTLKTFFYPEDYQGHIPEEIYKILAIFQISNPEILVPKSSSLH